MLFVLLTTERACNDKSHFIHTFVHSTLYPNFESPITIICVFGLQEEAGVLGGNPLQILCMASVPYVHHIWSLLCFSTISLFGDFAHDPMILQIPSGDHICRNLSKCGGSTDSFRDWIKVPLESCHHCLIENTHRHFLKTQFPLNWRMLVHLKCNTCESNLTQNSLYNCLKP